MIISSFYSWPITYMGDSLYQANFAHPVTRKEKDTGSHGRKRCWKTDAGSLQIVRPDDGMHPSFSGVPLSLWRAESMQSRNVSSSLFRQNENPGMEMPPSPVLVSLLTYGAPPSETRMRTARHPIPGGPFQADRFSWPLGSPNSRSNGTERHRKSRPEC